MSYNVMRGKVEGIIEEIAPYSYRGRVYYFILEAVSEIEACDFLMKYSESKKYAMKTLERLYRRGKNLRNFIYSTYVLGESNNKSKL